MIKNQKFFGYTLIELLVVLSIISTIFGIGFISYRDFSRRQQVTSAMRAIRSDMRSAQERAISGNKPTGCNGTLQGFAFNVRSAQNYRVEAICNTNVTVSNVNLAQNISMSIPATNPIIFLPIGLGTNLPRNQIETIDVTQTATSYSQSISVSWTGEIK
ncbi:hypothetical protein A2630_03315 [Candidatus Woesebacteria bacterium RIFCSPHIGHO2_01_FULL_44_10]|uniref:General secretion pathway GspH domain-containing protein n=1 Tax=Candidatus Woesebacteria bacterium RIFCSPLOWO2_01_FULL_44_14 TaxID=1802525 RepID=A0A1F8BXK4_9BACT|nr:MAG: hypothetical protein A2630_03315 [Candidatus Woesebacteria bacterium RIFCSPHIGHO2_01_FULL_44_10]OGM56440.1 MAG: hypothetical protein A3F62_01975 [Candidatus Woesebacteria bacterium RIFCSPHIGHO2_12_FULL_44_11]OGM68841.1 MAG: hypothetical protein A2975_00520 [Candidatus Woesebacteria bacterium RIFCSPLOWO2_01_FULL_44_14]